MLKRTITAIGIILITAGFLALRLIDNRLFDIFLFLMAMIGTFEFHRAVGEKTTKAQEMISYAFVISSFAVAIFFGKFLLATIMIFVAANLFLLIVDIEKYNLENTAISILSLFYPTLFLVTLHFLNVEGHYSNLILAFVVTPFADSGAYLIGSLFKGKKLCPSISPKKTISGAIGGLFGAILASLLVYFIFGEVIFGTALDVILYIDIGLVCGLLTELGDLVESKIKREIGIKDTGKLLPGHGGMLDRIDGLMFAGLAIYLFFGFLLPIL
ncbi:MAG: phosphatidate cytidylyltransferase [Clostridia bacterium]|nr:phosphatidate cytidylyltransferase [Clostridia bacterium]